MGIGPVEYVIIGFPGNQFNGQIAPELAKLIESGTIRLLDLVFILKDGDGNVVAVEFDEHEQLAAFSSLEGEVGGFIGEEDVQHAADLHAEGWSLRQIGAELGVHWSTVSEQLQRAGITMRPSGAPHIPLPHNSSWSCAI